MDNRREVQIEDAKITFRNFKGKKTNYSPEGRRTFHVILPEDVARDLESLGWNIRWPKPESGLLPSTEIIVAFEGAFPPKIYQKTSKNTVKLTEDLVGELDNLDIEKVDMIVTPYNWNVNGKRGVKGYLKTLFVFVKEDPLELKYLADSDGDRSV